MSDEYWKSLAAYEDKITRYVDSNNTKTTTTSSVKILKILLCTLVAVILVQVIAYFVVIPTTTTYSVTFEGVQNADVAELQSLMAMACGSNWFKFDTAKAASALLSVSTIESATVQKSFPNKILITVKERNPVAMALVTINHRTIPVQVDNNGVLFSDMAETYNQNLPLITGLNIDNFYNGMVLDSKYHTLLEEITTINKNNPEYFSVISEIAIQKKEYDNFELVIYPVHTKTRVLMDRNINKDVLEYMFIALDVVNSINPDVKEVDLRYGAISYKL